MNTHRFLFLTAVLIGAGCVPKAYEGKRLDASRICRIEGSESMLISEIDGKSAKAQRGLLKDYARTIEALPGTHKIGFQSTRSKESAELTFTCKAGHHYRIRLRSISAGIYGEKGVWMIEDADTKEVVTYQRP